MVLRADQWQAHLRQGHLSPVYLLAGEEPLQLQEAADGLRAVAREQGHSERTVLTVDAGFDWGQLHAAGANLSLFGERRLLELRMPGGKPGQTGARVLADWCKSPPDDTVLLVLCGRLEAAQRRAAWFRAIDRAGQVLQVWPLPLSQLQAWVRRRMQTTELQPAAGAVELLAERSEGNLLAASQEIEKLRLLHGAGPITVQDVGDAVADSARHDVFGLAEAAFSGQPARLLRIARHLRAEAAEPVLALWALAAGVRAAAAIRIGQAPREALQQNRVFGDLGRAVERGARRHSGARWEQLLSRAATVDRVIKGASSGRGWGEPWNELINFGLAISGSSVVQEEA
ncbi:DNA polymerase III subunit delta [Methylonatrum kenyense]|uniref:DNA polymerase III subunit delta n=1 Tax=Methylonatrum kenyense TaxID=455253 RepID=UPI0020BE425D|nr:DNA polymerase III subunit delta [Methylonatrum kenyense]MCK8516240.1 DNA polymerase III subunit delta [Methylonatrum kenyense]